MTVLVDVTGDALNTRNDLKGLGIISDFPHSDVDVCQGAELEVGYWSAVAQYPGTPGPVDTKMIWCISVLYESRCRRRKNIS